MITATFTGFLTSFALILAIGAQNAFVLRQGILQNHVFWVALTCALSDALLIAAGVAGFGVMIDLIPSLPVIMRYAGAAFLLLYGATRFYAAYKGGEVMEKGHSGGGLRTTILTCLALTWLNPHVYLDTLGLLGAISTQFDSTALKVGFGFGAVSASFVFFFGLAYGARLLTPIMQTARTWQILDIMIGLLMWVLAYGLISGI